MSGAVSRRLSQPPLVPTANRGPTCQRMNPPNTPSVRASSPNVSSRTAPPWALNVSGPNREVAPAVSICARVSISSPTASPGSLQKAGSSQRNEAS